MNHKKSLFFLFFIIGAFHLNGQNIGDNSKIFPDSLGTKKAYNIGINATIFRTALFGTSFSPGLTFFNKRHSLFIGPKHIIDGAGSYFNVPKGIWDRLGFKAGYQFYPNKVTAKFDVFFEYIIQYTNLKKGYSDSLMRPYLIVTHKIVENTLGFGFKANLPAGFYLNGSVGIGIGNIFRYEGNPSGKYIPMSWWEDDYYVGFGLGYKFSKTKEEKQY